VTGTTADQHDQAWKRLTDLQGVPGKSQEVGPVTAEDDSALGLGKLKDLLVRGGDGERLTKRLRIMTPVSKQVLHFGWHVVVEEEFHTPDSAICSATRASISVR
jgi:hypothetical protein